jgi:hypothetical protein
MKKIPVLRAEHPWVCRVFLQCTLNLLLGCQSAPSRIGDDLLAPSTRARFEYISRNILG